VLREITLLKCKYDGSVKREHEGLLVDERDGWVTVACLAGIHQHLHHGVPVEDERGDALVHMSTRLPLTAINWFQDGRLVERYVDAALPARFDGAVASYVDLDLDIVAVIGERPYVKDIADFEANRVAMAYPPDVLAAAWQGIQLGSELIAVGAFPFNGAAEQSMSRAIEVARRGRAGPIAR
jgi:hypothetical protein